jgi:hypothetical protein
MGDNAKRAWPADRVERRSVDSLVPAARNARKHSGKQIDSIAAAIEEWGFTTAVLIDEDGNIIAGHGRVLAAKKLGLPDIPVMVARGWTAAQKRAYLLADNKMALNSEWDDDLLKAELLDLGEDFDLDLVGFTEGELAKMFPPEREQAEPVEKTKNAVIQFNIVFDDAGQQEDWFQFLCAGHTRTAYRRSGRQQNWATLVRSRSEC